MLEAGERLHIIPLGLLVQAVAVGAVLVLFLVVLLAEAVQLLEEAALLVQVVAEADALFLAAILDLAAPVSSS